MILPMGQSAMPASLRCAHANGMPIMVMASTMASYGWRALIAAEIIVGTSGIGFLMFDARRAGSVVEILLGMIILGILWYIVDSWILAPIERATGQRWGLVTR